MYAIKLHRPALWLVSSSLSTDISKYICLYVENLQPYKLRYAQSDGCHVQVTTV